MPKLHWPKYAKVLLFCFICSRIYLSFRPFRAAVTHLTNSSRPTCLFTHINPMHVKKYWKVIIAHMAPWLLITFCLNSYNSRTAWDVASQGFSLKDILRSFISFCFHITSSYTLVLTTLCFHKPIQCFYLVASAQSQKRASEMLIYLLNCVLPFSTEINFT